MGACVLIDCLLVDDAVCFTWLCRRQSNTVIFLDGCAIEDLELLPLLGFWYGRIELMFPFVL